LSKSEGGRRREPLQSARRVERGNLGTALTLVAAALVIVLLVDASDLTLTLGLPVDGWEALVVLGGFAAAGLALAGGLALWRVSGPTKGVTGCI
jgi:hypothetical protein